MTGGYSLKSLRVIDDHVQIKGHEFNKLEFGMNQTECTISGTMPEIVYRRAQGKLAMENSVRFWKEDSCQQEKERLCHHIVFYALCE